MKTERAAKPCVMIVDDDRDFQFILGQWLKPRYETVPLTSGEELMSLAPALSPDLIIMDVGLPGPDGFRLCHRLRADARFAGTPILFLTASRSNEDFLKNLEVGGSAYLTKPVERGHLLRMIQELLGGSPARR